MISSQEMVVITFQHLRQRSNPEWMKDMALEMATIICYHVKKEIPMDGMPYLSILP